MPLTEYERTAAPRQERRTADSAAARPRGRGRPSGALAWAVPFAAVLAVLLARNAVVFSTPLYEDADMGANSILIEQARRFTLLTGHYSREHFNHPGPAFLYVQAWGESLFWSALHLVPAAWNGQLIAVYALNAVFAGLVVVVGYRWTRSARTAAAFLATLLAFAAVRPEIFSSSWMPYVLMPAFLAFLVACASVAAGRVRDSWIAALAGWFLINGNVAFLFFVPLLAAVTVLALAWPRRRRLPAALRSFARQRAVWLPVVIISVVFAFPMAANTALHWPGEFGKYLSYSSSARAGGHSVRQVADYMLWFWWPHRYAWLVPPLCYLVAGALTWRLTTGPARRLAVSLLTLSTFTSAAFAFYAIAGIDELDATGRFIGYFYWSAPVALALVAALGVTAALPPWPGRALAAAAAVAACAAFAVAPLARTSTAHVDPLTPAASGPAADPVLPAAVAAMANLAAGRPVILRLDHRAWPAMTGLLVQAERTGVPLCVASPRWAFMVTSQFVCTPMQQATGLPVYLHALGTVRRGMPVLFRLRRGIVTAGAK